ncbi:putative major intrinsic protein [Plasmopara halstedii]
MSTSSGKIENGSVEVHRSDSTMNYKPLKPFQVKSSLVRECFAEFLGTMVLIMFGDGAVAQVVLGEGTKGDYINITLCWGQGVFFGIHISGGVSGAHLNPAVTTTLACFGRMKWNKVPYYIISQLLGAFAAAFVVWGVYYPMFDVIDPEKTSTGAVFATYPYSDDIPVFTCFLTEVVGSALLMGCIFAIGDQLNKPASPYSQPTAVALVVVAIGMAFGMNSGFAINPARDFGPRLFTYCAGWGSRVFTFRDSYFWVPIFGPLLGGPIGAGIYVGLIEHHHRREYKHRLECISVL